MFLQLQLGRRQPGSSAVGTMNWNAKDYNEISLNCIWSEHVRAAPFVALQCTPSRRLLFAATVRPFGTPGLSSRVRVLRPASGGEGGEADSKGYQDDVHVQSVLVARAEQRPRQPPYAQRPNAAQGAAIPGARRQRRTRPRRAPAAACLLLLLLSLSLSLSSLFLSLSLSLSLSSLSLSHTLSLSSSAVSLESQRFD